MKGLYYIIVVFFISSFLLFHCNSTAFALPSVKAETKNIKSVGSYFKTTLKQIKANNLDSALNNCLALDSLNLFLGGNEMVQLNIDTLKLHIFEKQGKHDLALSLALYTYYKASFQKHVSLCNPDCYIFLDYLLEYMKSSKDYQKTIMFSKEMLKYNCLDREKKEHLHFIIALNLNDIKGFDKSISYYDSLVVYAQSTNNSSDIIDYYIRIGTFWSLYSNNVKDALPAENYNKALAFFNSAIFMLKGTKKDIQRKEQIDAHLALLYYKIRNSELAKKYTLEYIQGTLNNQDTVEYKFAVYVYALIEYSDKNYASGIKRLENIISNYCKKGFPDNIDLQILKLTAKLYEKTNNTKKVVSYLLKLNSASSIQHRKKLKKANSSLSIHSRALYENVQSLMIKESELRDKRLEKEKVEAKQKEERTYFIWTILLLMFISTLLLFWRYRQNQQKTAIIKEKELQISKDRLIFEQIERHKNLETLRNSKQNVTTLTLELVSKNGFKDILIKRLKEIKSISKSDILSLDQFIQNECKAKSENYLVDDLISKVGDDFFENIKTSHKELNPIDLKLIGMVILGMPNKEIAIAKNISPSSAKMSKNRLKKKLGLKSEEELQLYLEKFI